MMEWSDYLAEVKTDAMREIDDDPKQWDSWDDCYDMLFLNDAVTGNGSGSYTFSTAKAAENVAGIIWDPAITALFREMGYDGIPVNEGPEAVDVIARCIALGEVSGELAEYFNEKLEEVA